MHLFVLIVAFGIAFTHGYGYPKTAKGLNFIGVGYDILRGNPDGDLSKGGIDPELKITRKILKLTWNDGNLQLIRSTRCQIRLFLLIATPVQQKPCKKFFLEPNPTKTNSRLG